MLMEVDLPERDVAVLDAVGRRDNISREQVVRRAVVELAMKEGRHGVASLSWEDMDGLDYQRRIRNEWPD